MILGLSAHNVVAIGDAENDHAFLKSSGYAVAVANALPAVKDEADLVTKGARGAGVAELITLIAQRASDGPPLPAKVAAPRAALCLESNCAATPAEPPPPEASLRQNREGDIGGYGLVKFPSKWIRAPGGVPPQRTAIDNARRDISEIPSRPDILRIALDLWLRAKGYLK